MSLFSNKSKADTTALIDIGSGSVGVAILHKNSESEIKIIWSHREYSNLTSATPTKTDKAIRTTLLNALMQLDSTGRRVLLEMAPRAKIEHTQFLVSAPWIHTIAKTAEYKKDQPFTINDDIINQLIDTAEADIHTTLVEINQQHNTNLHVVNSFTAQYLANGYKITAWNGSKVRSFRIEQIASLSHASLLDTIYDMHEKILPKTTLDINSYMTAFFETFRIKYPELQEVCLLHLTAEATEIGIIRNGMLRFVSSIGTGSYTLAREITKATKAPLSEAYALIADLHQQKEINSEVEKIFTTYLTEVTELFESADDKLLIPRSIFLHANEDVSETFQKLFSEQIPKSLQANFNIHLVNKEMFKTEEIMDVMLILAKHYYLGAEKIE